MSPTKNIAVNVHKHKKNTEHFKF